MKLHKLSVHFVIEEMIESSFIEKISVALDSFLGKNPIPIDLAIHSLNILFYIHLWKLRNLLTKVNMLYHIFSLTKFRAKFLKMTVLIMPK